MRKLSVVLLALAVCSQCFADTVTLKNGGVVTGKVIQSDGKTTTIEIPTEAVSKVEYGEQEAADRRPPRRIAVMWNPIPTLFTAAAGGGITDFQFEAEGAAAGWLTLYGCLDIASSFRETAFNLRAGPKIRLGANYLQGWFLGLYPGLFVLPSYLSSLSFDITAEAGHEWVMDSGLLLGLNVGATYIVGGYPMSIFGLGFHLGYAF